MRFLVAGLVLAACMAASGCATALLGVATVASLQFPRTSPSEFAASAADYSTPEGSELAARLAAAIEEQPSLPTNAAEIVANPPVEVEAEPAELPTSRRQPPEPESEFSFAADQEEVMGVPEPAGGRFKPREDESDLDRFNRSVAEVPLDIRPTEGAMPTDVAAREFAAAAAEGDPRECDPGPLVACAYTPWTMCFRPLYFEEICVERYGCRVPYLQSTISGAQFLKNVALLPYKMRVQPPRSCVCSNGFSRCGDPMPVGYDPCVWRWDAAAIEIAAVTGFVFILP
jgi:hypothetical protein